jgi:hypothetical protein
MAVESNIGNLADLKEVEVLLPAYLIREAEGIFVDLSLFPVGGGFVQFIDRMFGGGARFSGLDYRVLMDLIYDYDAILDMHGLDAKLRLAQDIVPFSAKRKSLYRAVKMDSDYQRAEYFFEPVSIEVVTEEPVYGEAGPDGVTPVVSAERKVEIQPTKLELDEFIADMWLKGVRFGIEAETVAGVISRGEMGRMRIATQLDPVEGSDAEIEEACSVLHRDNSPKILLNGKADLRKFQNRFPQIEKDARLLKKKPRVLGKPGYKVNGAAIEPEIPKDLDIFPLAGPGTRIERQEGNEYIIADRDGFLSLDTSSNNISVTEKIENKGGISVRTTGDLSLSGNEFIEHGEVQEGRSVEGKNMTFRSAVYGNVLSQGGFVLLESNLSNGSAKSIGGDITSNGRAFNSIIEAWDGKISMKYAESCLILGETVEIERAVNCEIIAEKIEIESVEGCGIAGKQVHIKSSDSCRGKQTIISMLLPDLSQMDGQVQQVLKAIADCKKIIEAKEQDIAKISSDAEVAKYLTLAANIRQGVVKLTEAHQENWQKMLARFSKVDGALNRLSADKQMQLDKIQALLEENVHLLEMREKSGAGVHCGIDMVTGDTMVRGVVAQNGVAEFRKSKVGDIKTKLREQGSQKERIFSNGTGTLDWNYELPDVEELS